MESVKKTFLKSLDLFKRMRVRTFELEYDKQKKDEENDKRIDELHNNLMIRLNEDTRSMLIEYVDRLVAKYNNDGSYFYDKGFSDCYNLIKLCKHTYRGMLKLPPLKDDTFDIEELL